jgi:hypothetical protein
VQTGQSAEPQSDAAAPDTSSSRSKHSRHKAAAPDAEKIASAKAKRSRREAPQVPLAPKLEPAPNMQTAEKNSDNSKLF